jgi:hypothetical protein
LSGEICSVLVARKKIKGFDVSLPLVDLQKEKTFKPPKAKTKKKKSSLWRKKEKRKEPLDQVIYKHFLMF